MHPRPTRHRIALVVALLGAALSAVTLVVHERIAGGGYTSFCNFGGVVNCDAVLGSRYGVVLGIPVAGWGLAGFSLGAVAALPGAFGGATGGIADLALIALASGGLGFALVLAVVMASLRHVCLLCLGLDVLVATWFV